MPFQCFQAVGVVSSCIAKRDFSTLQGLVSSDVLEQIESIVSNLGDEEIKDMAFDEDDMYLYLPVQLDIFNDAECKFCTMDTVLFLYSSVRFVNRHITVAYFSAVHCNYHNTFLISLV